MGDFGDFEEVVEGGTDGVEEQVTRVRIPRNGEVIGIVVQRHGGNRMEVKTTDGKSRNCRVPGRFARALWLRPGDVVMIKPWVDDNEKGDVIFKYTPSAINQLKKKGMLSSIKEGF